VQAGALDEARERLRPYVERARSFTGWSRLPRFRRLGPANPWDYMARARDLLKGCERALDMGTGGGERYGELIFGYEGRAIATEEWHVNAPIAAEHLRPLGAEVVHCASLLLPFADASFDLVLNRHEDLEPAEVARVLKPGGTVLTQQAFMIWKEMNVFFPRRLFLANLFQDYRDGLAAAGLNVVDARSFECPAAYKDLGDFVFMLCVAPWEVPDFDPLGADLEALLELERALTTEDGLVLTDGNFIIEACKPA
jgi:SAM-dependent methyltransferase